MTEVGVPGVVASGLHQHEAAHANADEERRGYFGFRVTAGWIIAYYMIIGERTPQQMMEIASAPGFSDMSEQDWKIYNEAWVDHLRDLRLASLEERWKNSNGDNLELNPLVPNQEREEKKLEPPSFIDFSRLSEKDPINGSYSKGELVEMLADRLDGYELDGWTPSVKELLGNKFGDFWRVYGETIDDAYREVVSNMKEEFSDPLLVTS